MIHLPLGRRTLLATALASLATRLASPALSATGEQFMPPVSGYAPVNGVNLWYETHGQGRPLVLLHGGLGSTGMFAAILPLLAAGRQVIGVDLQGHGRTGPLGRPMSFATLATDIAELIRFLGFGKADVMGYSLGGGVALRLAIDHPALVDRLVLVSTAFASDNWHDYNLTGMRGMAADPVAAAESLRGSPIHEAYRAVAPGGEQSWPAAVREVASLVGQDFDWSADIARVTAPTLLVVGDWDSIRIGRATQFFELLGGGGQDANWDRSGMNRNRFAVLPDTTHYDIFMSPALPAVITPFLDKGRPEGR